ncbi:MAG: glutamate synthase, partial [Myxococcota bacterium]
MKTTVSFADRIIRARRAWEASRPTAAAATRKESAEGGCGVIGLVASEPVAGRHLFRPLSQMNNRGNGKGGGIAVAGCFPEHPRHFALHVAMLDDDVRSELEKRFIGPHFSIDQVQELHHVRDHRDVGRLEVAPPDVVRYFVRVKPEVLEAFAAELGLEPDDSVEGELVSRNSCALNDAYYRADNPRAFVLSHGRNLMILKGVGYAEDILKYYQLEDFGGMAWIGHQRYPTRGRVWHPGGAHPFAGLDEALVHNGDLANYQAIVEYLAQRGVVPRFLTDTEVAALLFDLYNRVYRYPIEHIFEALAPTTERDFAMLPKDKQRVYRALRASHLHGSPDGPFFFILLRTLPHDGKVQLVGITDTSMLRPQVFAWHQGDVQIGLVASEKQAIDAYLEELSRVDGRVSPVADRFWNARGGSYTDGGAFVFTA